MTDTFKIGPSAEGLTDEPAQVVESNFDAGTINIGPDDVAKAEPAEELIGGKFKSQDDLLKAYKELESKLGAPKAEDEAAEETPAEETKEGEEPAEETPAEEEDEKSEAPKIDFDSYAKEFAETGSLSEETIESIEKAGIPRAMTEVYVEGFKAIQTLRGNSLYEAAGGKDEFDALVKWGSTNLDEKQRGAFDKAIDTAILEGDATAATMLIQSVKASMGGTEPRYVDGKNVPNTNGIKPFESRTEMMEAMKDRRYKTDPSFVSQVQQRLAVSDI